MKKQNLQEELYEKHKKEQNEQSEKRFQDLDFLEWKIFPVIEEVNICLVVQGRMEKKTF